MARRAIFVDEAGNFDFRRGTGASRYFILTSVALDSFAIGDALMQLRRELAWEGIDHEGHFRATEEAQAIRDRVFDVLSRHPFTVDATIIDKPKVALSDRVDHARFYKTAWYLHLQYVAPMIVSREDEALIVAASVGTHRERSVFREAMDDVVREHLAGSSVRTAFWSSASEPCLQLADYCSWAIQRKWERGDVRSYNLIREKIRSEYDALKGENLLNY